MSDAKRARALSWLNLLKRAAPIASVVLYAPALFGTAQLVLAPTDRVAGQHAEVAQTGVGIPIPSFAPSPWNPSPTSTPAAKKTTLPSTSTTHAPGPGSHPGPNGTPHVLVIMEENKGYAATIGSCGADPYLCSLAATYGSDSSWFGVSHPSEPNYVALDSGGIQGCTSDTACHADSLTQQDLGGQLSAAGIPWVGYMESMPSPCYTGSGAGGYALKHNPFGFFKDNYAGTCHILPYPGVSGLLSVLNGANAPDFVWITPNLIDDMHDGTVQQGDAWLRANLAPVLSSRWFTRGNSTAIVTMDENDAVGGTGCCGVAAGGQIPMVVVSSRGRSKGSFTLTGDHYGFLRSMEEVFGLGLLGLARTSGNGDLTALFG